MRIVRIIILRITIVRSSIKNKIYAESSLALAITPTCLVKIKPLNGCILSSRVALGRELQSLAMRSFPLSSLHQGNWFLLE